MPDEPIEYKCPNCLKVHRTSGNQYCPACAHYREQYGVRGYVSIVNGSMRKLSSAEKKAAKAAHKEGHQPTCCGPAICDCLRAGGAS
jgi:hypothetical protein